MRQQRGFSLLELVVTVGIIGLLAGVAAVTLGGSRAHAKAVGDARANASTLRMMIETGRAESGQYPTAGTYIWTATGGRPTPDPAPGFIITKASLMDYTLVVNADRLTYTLTATAPKEANKLYYQTDQTGADIGAP